VNNNYNSNNNELNGNVLGNTNVNGINEVPEMLETLDAPVGGQLNESQSANMGNNYEQSAPMPQQSTFFNSPVGNNGINNGVSVPEPAYTNPQSINPMPGFESPNTIGTTPPISFEPEKQPKKKQNKTWFVILIIVVLFGIGFGVFALLRYTDLLNPSIKVEIKTKELEVSLNEKLSSDVKDYADISGTDNKNCSVDTTKVDITKEGEYKFQVKCGEKISEGIIKVVDNEDLKVEVKPLYKVKDDTVEAKDFIVEVNKDYNYEFVNKEEVLNNLKTIGRYTVKIKAIKGEKTKEVDATLVVIEYKIKGYLICESNSQQLQGSSTTKVNSQKFGIYDTNENKFAGVASEINTFKFVDETEYVNYVAKYNNEGKITIDNISGTPNFDDANLTITLSNELKREDLISKYGEETINTFISIKTYYEKTLGYSCSYQKEG